MEVMQLISSIDWERESYPVYKDFMALPFLVIFFPTVRFLLDRYIFQKVAGRLILGKEYEKLNIDADDRRKKINKFKESAWKSIYYLSSEILSLSVTCREPWFRSTKYYWAGPGDQAWPDRKMKFARVGVIVLAVHDASDVFLEIAKMSKYSSFEAIASVAFLLFVISWLLLRLIYYPFWILRSTSYELVPILDNNKNGFDGPIYYYVFNTLLFFLLVLHIYWWVLMFRMLVKQMNSIGHVSDDVRSDSEDEDGHEN